MKMLTLALAVMLTSTMAFAHNHEEGHDKEHQHTTKKIDHKHVDAHHQPHDHKAHHPDHGKTKKSKRNSKSDKVKTRK